MGQINTPQIKLLIPWIKSKGNPATIHAMVDLKFNPKSIACDGAYNMPNKNPCNAATDI